VLLASAAPAVRPRERADDEPIATRTLAPVLAPPKPIPSGWPAKTAAPVWAWLTQQRAPLPVLVAGAEGGVGTSTVTALLADTIAAASPGPTVVLDQCGSPWGSLPRRLLGQRGGMAAEQAAGLLANGMSALRVLRAAPSTSAGAAVLTDPGYVPLRDVFRSVATVCGALLVDAGPVNLVLTARLDLRPVLVLVGRADVIGAEAVCAALGYLTHYAPGLHPVVVLTSSTGSTDRRRVHAATKLVAATGVPTPIELPFDPRLASGQPVHLDRLARPTVTACLRLVRGIATTHQEVSGYGR
jgi:MinD-like ATPase involved in chromosome partitioning or flagellar assembly